MARGNQGTGKDFLRRTVGKDMTDKQFQWFYRRQVLVSVLIAIIRLPIAIWRFIRAGSFKEKPDPIWELLYKRRLEQYGDQSLDEITKT